MRIERNGSNIEVDKVADVSPVKGNRARGATGAGAGEDGNGVVVSPQTQTLTQAAGKSDAAHRAYIEKLRDQIQSGTYVIDKQKLAERMTDDELARGSK